MIPVEAFVSSSVSYCGSGRADAAAIALRQKHGLFFQQSHAPVITTSLSPNHVGYGSSVATIAPSASYSSSALHMLDSKTASTCFELFNGMKVPALLIAGCSLVSLFVMSRDVQNTSVMNKARIIQLRLYHMFCLLTFLLSMAAVLSAHSSTTMLLSNVNLSAASSSMDAYTFLTTYMNFEFLLTQWSFLSSIIMFLFATTFRMIVQFSLFSKRRKLAGTMAVSMMLGTVTSILSYVNTNTVKLLESWPNLGAMTVGLAKVRSF